MHTDIPPISATSTAKEPITNRIYDSILEDIRSGKLEPGQKLKVRELTSEYGGSTGSCREVLNRLAGERFVQTKGMTGFSVRDLSPEDLIEVLDLRDQLESQALVQAIQHGDTDWEEGMVLAFHRLERERIREGTSLIEREYYHREFHLALIGAHTSEWHQFFIRTLSLHSERYRRILLPKRIFEPDYVRVVDEEHELIMRLALERRAEEAAEALKKHRSRSRTDLLVALESR
ncbi:GntR family transcriptional regulator [Shimia sp. R10_1]|uniref:GntR family transcriptional regulator n=1 Tax=Shimia sp. R10_1 TaxID=2821095 RepID=UPI001AD959F4|nr:GntR family transcriptional regulator [Shimia sp. R10_1]MBO9475442.1 GntR family transcriptional regulator [Shimia sp. R10_1]